jgi:nucleoside-diphosphate-sugar epimerase
MKILVVGAGYVGAACAEHFLAANENVLCRTLSERSALELRKKGLLAVSGDCSLEESWRDFRFRPDVVLYCPATGGGDAGAYRQTYVRGMEMTLRHVPKEARLFYTSSTSVYAQDDGSWVDESSSLAPTAETSKVLLEAEQLAIGAGGVALRLSAIYGPGRLALRDRLLNGSAQLPANGERVLNQIHRDDVVAAVEFLLGQPDIRGEVFNVTDSYPATYRELYAWLCEKYRLPMPEQATGDTLKKRGFTNKRVGNKKLRVAGWQPKYPSFREGYLKCEE